MPRRVALLLGLLLSLPSPMKGAALSNASLQGNYFFTYQKIDAFILFPFGFTTATGTLTFDGTGNANVQGFVSRSGAVQIQFFSGSGTYTLESSGLVQVSILQVSPPIVSLKTTGSVSFDLESLVTTNIGAADSSLFSQEILLATRLPSPLVGGAFLKGKYFLAQRTITASGGSTPQLENAEGTITFDGQDTFTLGLQRNRPGSITTVNDSGKYQITGTGAFSLSFPGKTDPVQVGFTENGSFGVGATVAPGSTATHDLFVLNKADGSGLGNAGLNGSYQMVIATANANTGFAIAVGLVDYKGDGSGFYQFAQNEMGFAGTKMAATTFSAANDGSLQMQFAELLSAPNPFQAGLGNLGYSLVGASVNDDTSIYNFLVAVRTPSQPAAVANAGSFSGSTALSPGGLLTIFGRNLARQWIEASYVPCPGSGEPNCLPKQLGGATVKIGGIEAPLRFVSPFQINAQAPFELPAGQTSISIVLDGVESGPLPATVNAAGPGLFTTTQDGKGMGIFQHSADFSPVTESNPAHPRETIIIYATGLGAVLPAVASGLGVPVSPLFQTTSSVSVQIGGKDSTPSFAGLTSKFVGLYQINTPIPPDITSAQTLSVVVTAGGIQGNTVSIPVAP